jgi:hypothetical protein
MVGLAHPRRVSCPPWSPVPRTTNRADAEPVARPSSSAAGVTNAASLAAGARPTAPNIGRGSTGCGVGIDAFASPICAHAIMPPLSTRCGRTPKNAGSHSTRSASLPGSTEPTSSVDAVGDRRVDRVLGDVAARPQVVGAPSPGRAPAAAFITCAVCQVRMIDLADPAHRLESEPIIEIAPRSCRMSSAAIVWAGSGLGEREVLGHRRVEVVADHQHVEVLARAC